MNQNLQPEPVYVPRQQLTRGGPVHGGFIYVDTSPRERRHEIADLLSKLLDRPGNPVEYEYQLGIADGLIAAGWVRHAALPEWQCPSCGATTRAQMADSPKMTIFPAAVHEVLDELAAAQAKFGNFRSAHEGYAIILEELDEMWDEIKRNSVDRSIEEAIQVAAMALRYIIDIRALSIPKRAGE